jgi:hypothetical protein
VQNYQYKSPVGVTRTPLSKRPPIKLRPGPAPALALNEGDFSLAYIVVFFSLDTSLF